jgi:glycerophosphoryl diester phosphodiesterase
MLAIGHRGAAGHEPENTLRSIRCALDLGADWIEIDVQSIERELIVFHDDTLDRTTNGRGALSAKSFRELRALDAGGGEQVPTLTEVMDLIDARCGLNIELKGTDTVEDVLATIGNYQRAQDAWRDRILLSSFDISQTEVLASSERIFKLGVLFDDDPDEALLRAREYRAYSIHPSIEQVSENLITKAHASGIKVLVYTVNETADLIAMRSLGVDGVFSDFPDRILALRHL